MARRDGGRAERATQAVQPAASRAHRLGRDPGLFSSRPNTILLIQAFLLATPAPGERVSSSQEVGEFFFL